MPLSEAETRRYARHIVLKDMGGAGQQRLRSARVLVVGAGGLGCPVIAYLAAAGVGTLGVVDADTVALSDLHRQIVYAEAEIGAAKTEAAGRFVARINPHVRYVPHHLRLDADNAGALVSGYDLVVEGTDDFATRQAVADACAGAEIALVTGAVAQFDGALTVLAPHLCGAGGEPNPTFGCLYPDAPAPGDSPPCEVAGVLGVLPGVVGTMMANEAIKWIAGIGTPLIGRLLIYSARSGETRILRYRRRPGP